MRQILLPFLMLALSAASPTPDPEDARRPIPASFYRLAAAVPLPGKAPDWDYLAYDSAHEHLFIARRGAGLWVFDTRRQQLIRRIAKTEGAGATLLLPQLGRGFSIN